MVEDRTVTLQCVQGQVGLGGNEIAVATARQGTPFIGPGLLCGIADGFREELMKTGAAKKRRQRKIGINLIFFSLDL